MLRVLRGTLYGKGGADVTYGMVKTSLAAGSVLQLESSLRLHAYVSVFGVSRETQDVQ